MMISEEYNPFTVGKLLQLEERTIKHWGHETQAVTFSPFEESFRVILVFSSNVPNSEQSDPKKQGPH